MPLNFKALRRCFVLYVLVATLPILAVSNEAADSLYSEDESAIISLIQKEQNLAEKANLCDSLSKIFLGKFKLSESKIYAKKAAELYQSVNDDLSLHRAQHTLAVAMYAQGDLLQAIQYLSNNYSYYESIQDTQRKATTINAIGAVYYGTGNYDLALDDLKVVSHFARTIQDTVLYNASIYNIGVLYTLINQADSGLHYLSHSLDLRKKTIKGYSDKIVRSYNKISNAYLIKGNLDSAEHYLNKSIELNENQKYPNIEAFAALGELYYMRGQYDSALVYATKSYNQSTDFGEAEIIKQSTLLLSKIAEKQNDYKSAHKFYKEHITFLDSLQNYSIQAKLLMQHQKAQNEKERAVNDKINEQKLQKQQYATLIAGLVALALAIIALFYRRNLKQTRANHDELKKYNELVQNQKAQLEQANQDLNNTIRSRDTLLSVLSHDIRSPLNSIVTLFDAFAHNLISHDDLLKTSKNLLYNIKNLDELIRNLLLWSKSQSIDVSAKLTNQEIKPLIEKVLAIYKETAAQKNIELNIEYQSTYSFNTDADMFSMIFRNLLNNAIKFSNENSKVLVNVFEDSQNKCISIQDFGVGLTQEQIDAIFSKTLSSTFGTKNEKGSGLGLKLVVEFINKLGGTLKIDSKKNEGTKITILFANH